MKVCGSRVGFMRFKALMQLSLAQGANLGKVRTESVQKKRSVPAMAAKFVRTNRGDRLILRVVRSTVFNLEQNAKEPPKQVTRATQTFPKGPAPKRELRILLPQSTEAEPQAQEESRPALPVTPDFLTTPTPTSPSLNVTLPAKETGLIMHRDPDPDLIGSEALAPWSTLG